MSQEHEINKYPETENRNHNLRHDSKGNFRGYRVLTRHNPVIPIDTHEQALIEQVESTLSELPPYADLLKQAKSKDTIVDIFEHLSLPDNYITFLENDTHPIRSPEDKPSENGPIYYRKNWRLRVGTHADLIKRLEMGLAVSMAMCDRFGDTVRQGILCYGAFGFMLDCDEFRTDDKPDRPPPCFSFEAFLDQHPDITDIASYIIPSSRSLFENRPFKARAIVPFETPVFDKRVFHKIGDKLNTMLPFLPQGVTKNPIAVAFGAAHNAPQARKFDGYIARKNIQECIDEVIEQEKRKKRKPERYNTQNRTAPHLSHPQIFKNRIHTALDYIPADDYPTWISVGKALKNMGVDFDVWAEWSSKSHKYETALTKEKWGTFNDPPGKYTEGYIVDIAKRYGYEPRNNIDTQHRQQSLPTSEHYKIPSQQDFVESGIIEQAPQVEVREQPSYRYHTPETKIVCNEILCIDPDAGWDRDPIRNLYLPIFTPKYEYLNNLLPNKFAMNGQPSEIEKYRVWCTIIGKCQHCGGDTAKWWDRYKLIAGYYCDKCHRDYHIGSYLQYELERKLPNSIVSEYQGYLENAPEFQDFRLWQPGMITYLGAAMGTGKTTEITSEIRQLAKDGLGIGIIAVPRVTLAKQLLQVLRKEDGHSAWGGFFEDVSRDDKFIGTIGAIVCLPSLPNTRKKVDPDIPVYLAIDEIDFAYQLTALATDQATAVKKAIKECQHTTGLVLAGQTMPTLALEALIEEFQPEDVQGFYNTAPMASGQATIHKVLCDDGIQNTILASVEENIRQRLADGLTPYTFCNTRRDAHVLAERFKEHKTLILDANTKLFRENVALMENKKLSEHHDMLLATSTAAVGITIEDEQGCTIIGTGLLHGKRHLDNVVQETLRVRNPKAPIDIHYHDDYNFALPQAPSEASQADLKHENVKQAYQPDTYINTGASKNFAVSKALQDLADHLPEIYIKHHLENIGNRKIREREQQSDADTVIEITSTRKDVTDKEKKAVKEKMKKIFEMRRLQPNWITRGQHLVTDVPLRIAHREAAATALVIGWDETDWDETINATRQLNEDQTQIALALVESGINIDALNKQRRGYIALHTPHFVRSQFMEKAKETTPPFVEDGHGLELHNVELDHGIGEILHKLLPALEGKVFSQQESADTVWNALEEWIPHLQSGQLLGSMEAKRARFLYKGNTEYIVNWTCQFIETWYPLRVAKQLIDVDAQETEHNYAIAKQEHYDLRIQSFNSYLKKKGYTGEIVNPEYNLVDLPEPHNALKEQAQEIRKTTNKSIKEIARELYVSSQTIQKWCKGIQTPQQMETEQKKQKAQELRKTTNKSIKDIAKELGKNEGTISHWCKGIQTPQQIETEQKKQQAFEMIAVGKTNKEIADVLSVKIHTVKNWRRLFESESTDNVEVIEAELMDGEKSDTITDMIYCPQSNLWKSNLWIEKPMLALPSPAEHGDT